MEHVEEQQEAQAISISNVCEGAMVKAFENSLRKCLANIMDPNTEATRKREIKLVLSLHPKEDRVQINCEFDCTEKLASMIPATSRIYVGKDSEGTLYALTEDPRQMNIFTPPAPRKLPEPIQFAVNK
jgi:hypothetical protein